MYKLGFALLILSAVCCLGGPARADDPDVLAYVSGGSTGKIFEIRSAGPVEIFSAKGGFRPESMDGDGRGRLFICDSSNSEIHVLDRFRTCTGGANDGQDCSGASDCPDGTCDAGVWYLTTIYDRDSATAPAPEQPVGCSIVGRHLYFGERSGSGNKHGAWVIRDAAVTDTADAFNDPELLVSFSATSSDDVADIVIAPDVRLLMAIGDDVLVSDPPYTSFAPLISDLGQQVTGLAVNSVGEVFVAYGLDGTIEVFEWDGTPCGTYADVSPLRPTAMRFDLADNLYFTAPLRSNGKGGYPYMIAPDGGPATNQCGVGPLNATPLSPVAPDAEVGISLPSGSVSQELVFLDGDALTAKQCAALFTIDPEFVILDPDCVVTVTCRQMSLAEFEARTELYFPDTTCMDPPNAAECIEIVVDGAECLGGVTEVDWLFFVLTPVTLADRPALLYATGSGPLVPFEEDIITEFTAEFPDLPNDPKLKGARDRFGSSLVCAKGAPNRAPVADAGADQTVVCGSLVTLDGSASYDEDLVDAGALTYLWSGPAIPPGAEDDPSFQVDTSDLGSGDHVYSLTVTDTGIGAPDGPLSDTDTVTITVVDSTVPTIQSVTASPATLWPPDHEMRPVTIVVDATDDCGDVSCRITGVEHTDEALEAAGECGNGGGTFPDWSITGDLTLDIRAERCEGGQSVDDTRFYTVTVECTDDSGNSVTGTGTVSVWSDQGG